METLDTLPNKEIDLLDTPATCADAIQEESKLPQPNDQWDNWYSWEIF